jgi:hypothetical protein
MAFEECGGLLGEHGQCSVCIAPGLQLAAGAATSARAGGAVALPLLVSNRSAIARPLFVTGLWTREDKGDWRAESLGWERLAQDEERPVMVRASGFERGGLHTVEVMIAVASRWRWREERFAFSGAIHLEIEDDDDKAAPVVNIGGQSAGHGNTVYISGQTQAASRTERSQSAASIALSRSEKEERRLGLRGTAGGHWVAKNCPVSWRGFPASEVPSDGPILTADGILAAGRARREDGGNQIRLLAEAADGTVDEAVSGVISRRHFEVFIQCDCLMLRVTGSGGLKLNGERLRRDQVAVLNDGDVIAPVADAPNALGLKVTLQREHDEVRMIAFDRQPQSSRSE